MTEIAYTRGKKVRNSPRNVCVHTRNEVYTQEDQKHTQKDAKKGGQGLDRVYTWQNCIYTWEKRFFCSEIRQEMCVYTHEMRCTHKRTTKNTQIAPRKAAKTYTNGWVTCVYTAKHAWRRDRGIHIERGAYTKSMNPGDHTQKAKIHTRFHRDCMCAPRACIYTWTGVFRSCILCIS